MLQRPLSKNAMRFEAHLGYSPPAELMRSYLILPLPSWNNKGCNQWLYPFVDRSLAGPTGLRDWMLALHVYGQ